MVKTYASPPRLAIVDIARGIAISLMLAYHFCFDLNYFGFIKIDVYNDPLWVNARSVIVTLFLLVMGASLHLAHADGIRWHAMGRRLLQLGLAATAVTAGSYVLFPRSYIFFGVLHFIAVASLLGLPFVRRSRLALLAGIGLVWFGISFSDPFFNQSLLRWFGLMTYKPNTEDYVPLIPWFGVVLIGIFIGTWLRRSRHRLAQWQAQHAPYRVLRWTGRHSLLFYLVHQPVLLALLYLVDHTFR